jgi:hypothetical protein
MDKIIENKVARAGAMASNAYTECKRILGSMRAATSFLRELPSDHVPEETRQVTGEDTSV